MDYFVVGDNIRKYRELNNLTQDELAEMAQIHRVTLARYESGRVDPGTQALARIADVLGVTTDKLLGRDDAENENQHMPRTSEAIIVSGLIDKLPPEKRKKAVGIMNLLYGPETENEKRNDASDDT